MYIYTCVYIHICVCVCVKRAKRWADKMDEVGAERLRLAGLLMQTMDRIERESGIFLIKPMFAYKGK